MPLNLLPGRTFLRFYSALWLCCTLVHFALLNKHYGLGWQHAAADALVHQLLLFAGMSPLWLVIRFSIRERDLHPGVFFNALLAGLLLLAGWFYLTDAFLMRWLPDPDLRASFLEPARPVRLLTGLLTGGILFSSFLGTHLRQEARASVNREAELRDLVRRTELQALKDQLNPHFLYNSLNAISGLTVTDPEKAREMVVRLSAFLRRVLKQDAFQLSALVDELDLLEQYLAIERLRFGRNLSFAREVPSAELSVRLPAMILQPLIENAVKFGTGGAGSQGVIRLRVSGKEQEVLICLSNPFDPVGERFRGEGLGLKNVRNRLRLLYGNGQLLTVRVEGQVFHACLRLPRSLPADAGERPVRGAETPSDEKKEHSHE